MTWSQGRAQVGQWWPLLALTQVAFQQLPRLLRAVTPPHLISQVHAEKPHKPHLPCRVAPQQGGVGVGGGRAMLGCEGQRGLVAEASSESIRRCLHSQCIRLLSVHGPHLLQQIFSTCFFRSLPYLEQRSQCGESLKHT